MSFQNTQTMNNVPSLCDNIVSKAAIRISAKKDLIKQEISKDAPDYSVIGQLNKDILILEQILNSPGALLAGEGKDGDINLSDSAVRDLVDIKYTSNDFAKVRYYWKRGMRQALGNIVLNPSGKLILNNDCIIDYVMCFDISYSMGNAPLVEFAKYINMMFNGLLKSDVNIRLTCIVYGNGHDVFIKDELLTRANLGGICSLVDKHVGRKNNQDNNIRSDTMFGGPIKEMLNILKEKGNGFGLLFSDGMERSTDTDVISLLKNCFEIGEDGVGCLRDYNFDLCMATYGKSCGEDTKMQQLANFWNTNGGGRGNFACADNIFGLYKFVEEACSNMLYKNMAENIKIILPNGEERVVESLGKNPRDVPFKIDIKADVSGIYDNFELIDGADNDISVSYSYDGMSYSLTYPPADKVQIQNNIFYPSINTETAHKLNDVSEMQKTQTGIMDIELVKKELVVNKECYKLLLSLGKYDENNNFIPVRKSQGGDNVVDAAAKHQIPNIATYNELRMLIDLGQTFIDNNGSCDNDTGFRYCSAGISVSSRVDQQTSGRNQSSAYCAYGATVPGSGDVSDDDSDCADE